MHKPSSPPQTSRNNRKELRILIMLLDSRRILKGTWDCMKEEITTRNTGVRGYLCWVERAVRCSRALWHLTDKGKGHAGRGFV